MGGKYTIVHSALKVYSNGSSKATTQQAYLYIEYVCVDVY